MLDTVRVIKYGKFNAFRVDFHADYKGAEKYPKCHKNGHESVIIPPSVGSGTFLSEKGWYLLVLQSLKKI